MEHEVTMFCAERQRLQEIHQRKVIAWSNAVSTLTLNVGICAQREYLKYSALAEVAREESMQAKHDLDRHLTEHHCTEFVSAK